MERHADMPTGGSLYSTIAIILGSTVGGMLLSALQSLNVATREITGPQATLIIGGLGLLWQVGKWLFYDRRKAQQAARAQGPIYWCYSCHAQAVSHPTDICQKCLKRA